MGKKIFIGLGGTGCNVLTSLLGQLNAENMKDIMFIGIDTAKKEMGELQSIKDAKGFDNVELLDMGCSGMTMEGVYESFEENEEKSISKWLGDWRRLSKNYLDSDADSGASQCRMKSRSLLCNFFKNNYLKNAINKILSAGEIEDKAPIIYIVSSIAGGTGAGSFIEVALWLRSYFSSISKSVQINGVLACPAIFEGAINSNGVDADKITSIYANGYAIIKELNALNVISQNAKTEEYAGNLKMEIFSLDECLFSSSRGVKEHPYDQVFIVDKMNEKNSCFAQTPSYYKIIADWLYACCFTPAAESLSEDIKSNGLARRVKKPLSYYGSIGASRIKYPRSDVVEYIAKRKVYDITKCDCGNGERNVWTLMSSLWNTYFEQKNRKALQTGNEYQPKPHEKRDKFIKDFETKYIEEDSFSNPVYADIKYMVTDGDDKSRIEKFMGDFYKKAHEYLSSEEILRFHSEVDDYLTTADVNEDLVKNFDERVTECIGTYIVKILRNLADSVPEFADTVVSRDASVFSSNSGSEINIVNGILKKNGKYIHPTAALYLIYKLQNRLEACRTGGDYNLTEINKAINFYAGKAKGSDEVFDLSSDATVKRQKNAMELTYKRHAARYVGKTIPNNHLTAVADAVKSANETIISLADTEATKLVCDGGAFICEVTKSICERLETIASGYESFLDGIAKFNSELGRDVERLASKNMKAESNTLYVGGSREAKERIYENLRGKSFSDAEANEKMGESVSRVILNNFYSKTDKKTIAVTGKKLYDTILDYYRDKVLSLGGVFPENIIDAMIEEIKSGYSGDEDITDEYIKSRLKKELLDAQSMAAALLHYNSQSGDTMRRYCCLSASSEASLESFTGERNADDSLRAIGIAASCPDPDKAADVSGNDEIMFVSAASGLLLEQMPQFSESGNSMCYKKYVERLSEISNPSRITLSPHIDRTWHLPGILPSLSRADETENRKDAARMFVWMLCRKEDRIVLKKVEGEYVYALTSSASDDFASGSPIMYNGMMIRENELSKVLLWIESKMNEFKNTYCKGEPVRIAIRTEIEKCFGSLRPEARISEFEASLTTTPFISALLGDSLSIFRSGNVIKRGILAVAASVHTSEELGTDKNFGERVLDAAAGIICYHFKAKLGEDINRSQERSDFEHMRDHYIELFINSYNKDEGRQNTDLMEWVEYNWKNSKNWDFADDGIN